MISMDDKGACAQTGRHDAVSDRPGKIHMKYFDSMDEEGLVQTEKCPVSIFRF